MKTYLNLSICGDESLTPGTEQERRSQGGKKYLHKGNFMLAFRQRAGS